MSEIQIKINQLKLKLENIKKEIENNKKIKNDRLIYQTISLRTSNSNSSTTLSTTSTNTTIINNENDNNSSNNNSNNSNSKSNNYFINTPIPNITHLRSRRTLQGHFGKVYSVCWSGDSQHLVSASQDGKLIIWNGLTTNKVLSIPLTSSWVITCAYEQSANRLVACGGMDNICSIYQVDRSSTNRVVRVSMELTGHRGYLSSCCFVNENQIVTSSGDSTCNVWDIQKNRPISIFTEHSSDVMSCCVSKTDPNIFVSGSCDTTAKIWDIRTNKSVVTFRYHSSDINSVSFFPDGNSIGTGSDDHTCHIMDMRSCQSLGCFGSDKILCGITSVAFSHSGRFLFSSYEDSSIRGWDIFQDPSAPCAIHLTGHEARVSSISISPNGESLLSGSWDTYLRVWA